MTEIVASDVHVDYDGHEVLTGVDLHARPGRMVAVTGPSGAGKTTLLWTLAGLVRPAQGKVEIDGAVPQDRDETSAAGVVLIPQDNALASVLTASENVIVPLLAAGVPPAEAAQRGSAVLADEPTSELDAVNRARVVLLLRAEADRGAAVVLATHDPDAAAECDAELHLDAGEATWVRPLT